MAAILRSSRILRSLLTKRLAAISSRTEIVNRFTNGLQSNAIGTNSTNPTNPMSSNDVSAQQIRRYTPIQSDIYDVRGAVAQPALGLKIGHSPPSKLGMAKLGTDTLPPRNPSETGTNKSINEGTQVGSACTNTIVVVANNSEATSQTQPIPNNLTPIVNVQNPASPMETSSQSALEATTIKQSFLPVCQNKIVTKSLILAVDIQHHISSMDTYSESMLEATAKMQNSLPPMSMAAGADKSGSSPPKKPPDVNISSVNTTNIGPHEKGNKCPKFVPKPPVSKSTCEDTLIVPTEPCRLAQSIVTWSSKVPSDPCKPPTSTGSKSTSSCEKKTESKKSTCASKKETPPSSEKKAGCAPKKKTASSSEKKSACASKKDTPTKSACASKKETPTKSDCASKKETPPSSEKKSSICFDKKPACVSTKTPPISCEITQESKKPTSSTKKEGCAPKKKTASSSEKKSGCAPKKKTPQSSDKKSACASKKEAPTKSACAPKKETSSSCEKKTESKKSDCGPKKETSSSCEKEAEGDKKSVEGTKCKIPMSTGRLVNAEPSAADKKPNTCGKTKANKRPESKKCMEDPCVKLLGLECGNKTNKAKDGGNKCRIPMKEGSMVDPGDSKSGSKSGSKSESKSGSKSGCSKGAPKPSSGSKVKFLAVPKKLLSNTIDTNLIDTSNSTMLKDNAVRPVIPALGTDKMENPDDIIQIMEAPTKQPVHTTVTSLKNVPCFPILDINPIRPVIPTFRKDQMENPDDIIQIMQPLTIQPHNTMDISLNNASNTPILKMSTMKPVISSLVADQMENPDDIIQIIGALQSQTASTTEIGLESTPKYAALKMNPIKPEISTLNENKIENPDNIVQIMEAPSSLQVKSTGISLKSRPDSSSLKGNSVTPTLDTNQKKNPTLNENQMENPDNIIQIMEAPSSIQVKSTDISLKSRSDSSSLKGNSVTSTLDTNQKKNTTENSKSQKTAELLTQKNTEIPRVRKELLLTNAQSTSRKLDEAREVDRNRNTERNHHKLQPKPVSTSKMQIQAKPNKTFENKSDTKVQHEFKWFKFIPRTNRHKSKTPEEVIQRPETPTYNPIKYIEKSVSMKVKDLRTSLDLVKSKTNLKTHSEIQIKMQTSTKEKLQPLCDTTPSKPIEKEENLSTSISNPLEKTVKPSVKGNTSSQGEGQSIADKKLKMSLVPKLTAPIQNTNKYIDSKKNTKTVTEEIVDKCFQFFSKKVMSGTSQNSEPSAEKKIQINNTSSVASKETSSLKKSLTHLNDKLGIENPIKVSTCDKAICRDSLLSRTPWKTNENFNQNQIKVKNENVTSKSDSSKDFLSIKRPAVVNPISSKTNVSTNTSNNIEEKLKKYVVSTSQLVSELDSGNTENSSSPPTNHSKTTSFSSKETKLVDPSRMKYAESVLPKPAETLPTKKPLEVAASTLPVKNEEVNTNSFLSEKENLKGSQLIIQSNQDIEDRDKETKEIEEFKRTANQILMEIDAILHTETCSKSRTDALPEHSRIPSVSHQEVSESKMSTENNLSKEGHSPVLLKSEPVLNNSSLEKQIKVSSIKVSPLDIKHNEMKFVYPKANEEKVDKLNVHEKSKSRSLNKITPKASTSSIVRSVVSKYNQMKASFTKLPISKSTSKLSSKTNTQHKDIKSSTKLRNDKKIELPIHSDNSKTASAGKIPYKVSETDALWSHKASKHNNNKFPTKLVSKNKVMPKNPEIQNVDQRKSSKELQTKKNEKPISTDLTNSGTSNKTIYKGSKTSFIKSDESKINQTKSSANINRRNADSHVNWEASKLALNRNVQFKNSVTSFGRSEVPKPTKTSTEVRRRKTENQNTKNVSKSADKSDIDSKTMSASTALSIKTKEMIKAQKRLTAIEKAESSPRVPRREEDFSPYRTPTATSQLAKTAKALHFEKQEASDRKAKVKIHVPGLSSTPEFGKSGSTKISTHIKQAPTDPSSEDVSKAKTLIKSMPESDINFRRSRSLFAPNKAKSLMEPKNQLSSKNQNNPIKASYGSIDPEKKASDRLSSTTRKLNKNDGSELTSTTKQEVKSVKIVNDPAKETESKTPVSIKELQMKSALQLAVENTAKVNQNKKTKSFGPNGGWTPLPVPAHKTEQSPTQQKSTAQQKSTTDVNKKNPKKIHTLAFIQDNAKTAD
ncbi:mucin-17-like isoform X2 [Teleopsis dalmanni]|uniref:mucin-17-like isoform X2 n=1 Tax=Teleopsis dalmanni TaxID=139649 RepID=UPI0018CC88D0|nr:mucin-17-like isoform X2 [Teleopsis dalmanni]